MWDMWGVTKMYQFCYFMLLTCFVPVTAFLQLTWLCHSLWRTAPCTLSASYFKGTHTSAFLPQHSLKLRKATQHRGATWKEWGINTSSGLALKQGEANWWLNILFEGPSLIHILFKPSYPVSCPLAPSPLFQLFVFLHSAFWNPILHRLATPKFLCQTLLSGNPKLR